MERSDKQLEQLRTYVVELAMLEFIKDNNLINDNEYMKTKNKIDTEYKTLNNSDYSFA